MCLEKQIMQALSDIFIASKFSKILEEKVKVCSRELASIEKKEEICRQMEDERCNLYKMTKSDSVAMRLSRRGISVRVLRKLWDKFGEQQCVSFCTCDVRANLPRVSKNVKVLQMIVRALKCYVGFLVLGGMMCGNLVSITDWIGAVFLGIFYLFTVLYVETMICHWLFVLFSDFL